MYKCSLNFIDSQILNENAAMESSMDWEAVWEDLGNDANGERSPEPYRALTMQKPISF